MYFNILYKIHLQKKVFLKEFPECFKETGSIFTHIPKAAGMSIGSSLYDYEVGHIPIIVYKKILENKFDNYFKFTFARHPLDRFVSAYEFLKQGGMKAYKNDLKFKQNVIDKYENIDDFIENWINEKNIYQYIHFIPQNYFICDEYGNNLMDFVGKLENIANDYQYVCNKLNIKNNLKFINKTNKNNNNGLSDSSKNKILAIYKKDFELLDY